MTIDKLLKLAAIILLLASCTKETNSNKDIYGVYNSMGGDIVTVSQGNSGMIKIHFAFANSFALRCTMDSVRINSDKSFTCNEYTTRENPGFTKVEPIVGSGKFESSKISFSMAISGTNFSFNGIKK